MFSVSNKAIMEENYNLAKWLNDEMSDKELLEFQSASDYHLYDKIKRYSSELEVPDFNEQKLFSKVMTAEKESPKVLKLQPNWMLRIAAILIIGLGLLFTYTTFSTTSEVAENGKQTTFSLPDKSEVVLNSGSTIEYKKWNWDSNRNLNLKGEAYFKVAKGKKFQVRTDLGKVSVLGTQFNVKARENRFDVTCYEGHVKVNYKDQEIIITKGESVAFEDGKLIYHMTATAEKPEWTSGEATFNQEHLDQMLQELSRQYNIQIELKEDINNQLFTGSLPTNNLKEALQILASTYHLKSNKVSEKKIILELVDVQK